jgi:hypothetical protein
VPVGDGVRKPHIHLCGTAFLGPVTTSVSDQTDAVRVRRAGLLAGFSSLFEIITSAGSSRLRPGAIPPSCPTARARPNHRRIP